jgi:hypothetical protein
MRSGADARHNRPSMRRRAARPPQAQVSTSDARTSPRLPSDRADARRESLEQQIEHIRTAIQTRLADLGTSGDGVASADRLFGKPLRRRDRDRVRLATASASADALLDCLYDEGMNEVAFEAVHHALRLGSLPFLSPTSLGLAVERGTSIAGKVTAKITRPRFGRESGWAHAHAPRVGTRNARALSLAKDFKKRYRENTVPPELESLKKRYERWLQVPRVRKQKPLDYLRKRFSDLLRSVPAK